MTDAPLVSIIMNCYNGEAFLREAINSVVAQTYPHWEIVFWDNCSTDGSATIAKSYDARLRYLRGEQNVPLGQARSLAMAQAQGDLVCFLDTDDTWRPDKLEEQVRWMADDSYSLCYGGIEEITEADAHIRNTLPLHSSGWILPGLLVQFDINIVTPMLRLPALRQRGLDFDPAIHGSEEYNLFMRLAAQTPICVIPRVLGQYRVREKSLTNQVIHKWAEERFYTLEQIKRENPGIEVRHPQEFRLAEARGAYYQARYHMALGDPVGARASLRPHRNAGLVYAGLYACLFAPAWLWSFLHRDAIKRRSLPKWLGFTK
jgi:glycosyltransferase involved in cell wall biosynthesis